MLNKLALLALFIMYHNILMSQDKMIIVGENYNQNEGNPYLAISNDGGASFTSVDLPFQSYQSPNSISFVNESFGYVCGRFNSIAKTIDGGNTWENMSLSGSGDIYDIQFLNENIGYLVAERFQGGELIGGIWKSENGGQSWTKVNEEIIKFSLLHFFNEDSGYVVASNRIYTTSDGGITFNQIHEILDNDGVPVSIKRFVFGDVKSYLSGLVNTDDPYINEHVLFESDDKGVSWNQISNPFGAIKAFEISDSNLYVYSNDFYKMGIDESIYSSLNAEFEGIDSYLYPNDLKVFKNDNTYVDEKGVHDQFKIWPNPATDFINIKSNNDCIIEIKDIYGRVVSYKKHFNSTVINLSNLEDGFYIIRLNNSNNRTIKETKLIIQ